MTFHTYKSYKEVTASERRIPGNAERIGKVNAGEILEIEVYLNPLPAGYAKMEEFGRSNNLHILSVDTDERKVILAGRAADFSRALRIDLYQFWSAEGRFRGLDGCFSLPSALMPAVAGVLGLDTRAIAQPHALLYDPTTRTIQTQPAYSSLTPVQLARLYNFPTTLDGSGQCIGIIHLGGGYRLKDLNTYFQELSIDLPKLTDISVEGGKNRPTTANSADSQVTACIEICGAVAPGAHIVNYFAPNTDRGFKNAINAAVQDTVNRPSVISISWGVAEANWSQQSLNLFDLAFQSAVEKNVTVCCASGDAGSTDGFADGKAHVDFPSSSPHVLACGGTRLEITGNTAFREVVWNNAPNSATGGGVSDAFALPEWQASAGVPTSVNGGRVGRGVPDVAGNADPTTGFQVYVDGTAFVLGGTSFVAPIWAALVAMLNQERSAPIGFLNPILYKNYGQLLEAKALREVTVGNNGGYTAGPGWNACTGLGTPDGLRLIEALAKIAPVE